jgi:DNA polymerase III sliding clamp (beta) subunit (PCNA family)
MNLVISELEKSREDYSSETIKGHEAKWGEFTYEFIESEFANCSELIDTREKYMTEAEYADMKEDFRNRIRLSSISYERDRINAFTLLGKHIPNWWD